MGQSVLGIRRGILIFHHEDHVFDDHFTVHGIFRGFEWL